MDDEQLAARRAEIPVHCCVCGDSFPGDTRLLNGICQECHAEAHGPNYRLIAALEGEREAHEHLRQLAGELVRILDSGGYLIPATAFFALKRALKETRDE